jgi:hypothetical protein
VKDKPRALFKTGLAAFTLVALFLLVRSKSLTNAVADKPPAPLWEIDLTKTGYRTGPSVTLESPEVWPLQQGVFFTEPNVVAIFFVAPDNLPGTADEQSQSAPSATYRLVAAFVSADNGKLIQKLEWPLPTPVRSASNAFLSRATKGRFIVVIGKIVSLYSPEFKLLARYDPQKEFLATPSPAGDTILLHEPQRIDGHWTSQFELLDTDQLTVRKSWSESSQIPTRILWSDELAWISSGSFSFGKPGQVPTISPNSLYLQTPDKAPRKLLDSKKEFCGYWSFINRDAIAVVDCGGEEKLLVVSTDGQIIRQIDLGLEQMYGPAMAAQNGRRFAVLTYEWGSARNRTPKKLTARVFDLSAKDPLLTVDLPRYSDAGPFSMPMGNTQFGPRGVALSPDGELLEVKSGPIARLYKVPEPGRSSNADSKDQHRAESAPPLATQPLPALPTPSAPSQLTQQVLSWLPADTETVITTNGPFPLPELNPQAYQTPGREESDHQVEDTFKYLPLMLFSFQHGLLGNYLKGDKILLAVQGSRHFHPPTSLGMAPFEGCAVSVFASDITGHADAFMGEASKRALRMEQIERHSVAVFQEKLEEDTWTTFVAFRKPNIAVVATNKEYLREVLSRLKGKGGERALPETLPEWKHVNAHASFWAVRHYDQKNAATDPTLPIGGGRAGNLTDDKAIGLTFSFDPANSKTATIMYFSGNKNIFQNVQKNLFPLESDPGAREMHIRYREVEPGIAEGFYDLTHIESAELFVFFLEGLLGHAIYL